MKLEITCSYSRLIYFLSAGEILERAITNITFNTPSFSHEGLNGYIETKVVFTIKDLAVFTNIWESWNSLTEKRKLQAYGLAKGLGDCK